MKEQIDRLKRALEFVDSCKADPTNAAATGAARDAREFLEEAARDLVKESIAEDALPRIGDVIEVLDSGGRWFTNVVASVNREIGRMNIQRNNHSIRIADGGSWRHIRRGVGSSD